MGWVANRHRHDPTLLPLPAAVGLQQAEAEVPLSFGEQLVPWRILAGHRLGSVAPLGFCEAEGNQQGDGAKPILHIIALYYYNYSIFRIF